MKNKRILISLGIIAVLVIYLIVSKNMDKGGSVRDLKKIDKIDELQITKENKTIKLTLNDDKWTVDDQYPADKVDSDKISDAVKELKFTDYITKEHHEMYDLTPEKAIQVIAKYEGKVLRDVMIGKTSSTNRTTYVRFTEEDKVYLAIGDLNRTFATTADKIRDKQIYKFEKNEITWFQVNYKGKILSFEKKAETVEEAKEEMSADIGPDVEKGNKNKTVEKWICAEFPKAEINKNKVDNFVIPLAAIRAESYPDIRKESLKSLSCLVKAKVAGKEITLSIHEKSDKDKEDYYCSSSESPYVFILREYAVKRFFKELKDFQDTEKKK